MSDRHFRVIQFNNADASMFTRVQIGHYNKRVSLEVRIWKRDGQFESTDLMGGGGSKTLITMDRFNRKRCQAIADRAFTEHYEDMKQMYESLIAKPEYADKGFPAWQDVRKDWESGKLSA